MGTASSDPQSKHWLLMAVVVMDSLEAYANRGKTVVKNSGDGTTETIFAARDIWFQDVTREL